ncbi:MTH938/NDUFAF3 family protein [Chloroflexota bacterium]
MRNLKIDNFRFGEIIIDGIKYQKDLIIFPNRVLTNWRREHGHTLNIDDLREVISAHPKVIIIGTGMFGRMRIPQKTLVDLEAAGIEVIVEKTQMACQTFNEKQNDFDIIVALHLTC